MTALADFPIVERTVPMERETLCVRLWELRSAAKRSQIEVAEGSKGAFEQPHYSQWESGKKLPSVLMLEPLAKALKCDLLDLFKRPSKASIAEYNRLRGRISEPDEAD